MLANDIQVLIKAALPVAIIFHLQIKAAVCGRTAGEAPRKLLRSGLNIPDKRERRPHCRRGIVSPSS
jgi:hypothetical protein